MSAGVILIAAGGNTTTWPNSPYYYPEVDMLPLPARYNGVLAIGASHDGATLADEVRSSYSLYVSDAEQKNVLVVAPVDGSSLNVYTTKLNGYDPTFNGTSAACPMVAGVVALMLSVNPTLTYSQISSALSATAEKIGPYQYSGGRTAEVGYGRINAYKVLKYILEHYGGTLSQNMTIPSGETWTFSPGVTLKFAPGTSLTSYGNIQAVGTGSGTNQKITLLPLKTRMPKRP